MKTVKFTSGTATKLDGQYFTLQLFNAANLVYSATLDLDAFMKVTSKHKNIKIVLN